MGTFNTLQIPVLCNNCNKTYTERIQFAYGDVWQHEYRIGDELIWDRNNVGVKHTKHVVIYGISEISLCPNCGIQLNNEYDIIAINNKIESIRPIESYTPYQAEEGGRFYIPLH
jgi:hypothetical protein